MFNILKKLLPHDFKQRLKRSLFAHRDMNSRLANLRNAGFVPSGAIDGGAYCGDWTREFWSIWPHCPVMMIEPLPSQSEMLTLQASRVPDSFFVSKAIGKDTREVQFNLQETNSGITDDKNGNVITVWCTTLDEILEAQPGFHPNILKLDLQGHELLALAGAERHLKQFEVILLEVSVLRIGNVPIFSEVDRYMQLRGYRFYDVLPQYYRPRDGALWQMDVFYVREDSALIASQSWN